MKTFLENYRGAYIYEVNPAAEFQGQTMGVKLMAEAKLLKEGNLKADFVEEGQDQEDSLKKIRKKIDVYLDKHDLKKFTADE